MILGLMGASAVLRPGAGRAPKPREVLYSDFVAAVTSGRVAAARQAGGKGKSVRQPWTCPTGARARRFEESRVYFTIKQPSDAAATGRAEAAPRGKAHKATAEQPSTSAAASSAPQQQAVPRPRFTPHFYTRRVPEHRDLIPLLVSSQVEFGVSTGWHSAAGKILTTILLLWIPLVPLFFVFKRIIDQQTGAGKVSARGSVRHV